MKRNRWMRYVGLLCGGAALLLGGCTSYVATQVTAFSNWSGSDATRTYAFTRTEVQRNSIEQATYEELVANVLSTYSFRPAQATAARYLVRLTYGIDSDFVTVAQPLYDPWFGGRGPYGRGRWGGYWGPWGAYPSYVNETYPVYTHSLAIRFTERATGREVYNVSARNMNGASSLVHAMPYLVNSALANFPLENGTVRTVQIPVSKDDDLPALSNERAPASSAPSAAEGIPVAQ